VFQDFLDKQVGLTFLWRPIPYSMALSAAETTVGLYSVLYEYVYLFPPGESNLLKINLL